jgi:hypothetical protein
MHAPPASPEFALYVVLWFGVLIHLKRVRHESTENCLPLPPRFSFVAVWAVNDGLTWDSLEVGPSWTSEHLIGGRNC